MSASGWCEAFLEMMAVERSAAKNTLAAYGRDLSDAQAFLAARKTDLAKAEPEDIEAYFAHIGAHGASPATAARRRSPARTSPILVRKSCPSPCCYVGPSAWRKMRAW